MKSFFFLYALVFLLPAGAFAQDGSGEYTLTIELEHTPVIDQGNTGTCWSFATTSFLESEIMRKGFPETDLSEMFFVYYAYQNKAEKYLSSRGKNHFSQGGQAHDVLDVLREYGIETNDAYDGKKIRGEYRHHGLVTKLTKELDDLNKKNNPVEIKKSHSFNSILKDNIGKVPEKIKVDGHRYSPSEFRDHFQLNPDDYVEITSYLHHPYYQAFSLEVPDNWAHELYYNLPVDEMITVMKNALKDGYTVCWDGDTSEKTFTSKKGTADVPDEYQGKVDQQLRQETFEDHSTTDDHLMHIVGLSKNPEGKTCFYTKNSWGANNNDFGGYLHMTEDYVRLKTIAILVHKNAIPKDIRKKLQL